MGVCGKGCWIAGEAVAPAPTANYRSRQHPTERDADAAVVGIFADDLGNGPSGLKLHPVVDRCIGDLLHYG